MIGESFNAQRSQHRRPRQRQAGGEVTGVHPRPRHADREANLNSGEAFPLPLKRRGEPNRKKGALDAGGSSDRPIVIGDGRAVHRVKGRAEGQRAQSTHAGDRNTPRKSVSSTLRALREKARKEPKHRFRALARLLDEQMLLESFHELKKKAAPGEDGVVWHEYATNLRGNLRVLQERLRSGRYRARLVRRRYIATANCKRRTLGIPVLEDKIVQQAARKIMESIFETDFLDCSWGYRPRRGARQAGQKLQHELFFSRVHWVVEADIKGFFDHMDHEWLLRMLGERVADRNFLRLVAKWLNAGVLEEDGRVIHPITETPQGGVISPVLANIYLHYAMDLWIKKVGDRQLGRARPILA